MPTKWLQERPNGSKNDPGMPHRRASRGLAREWVECSGCRTGFLQNGDRRRVLACCHSALLLSPSPSFTLLSLSPSVSRSLCLPASRAFLSRVPGVFAEPAGSAVTFILLPPWCTPSFYHRRCAFILLPSVCTTTVSKGAKSTEVRGTPARLKPSILSPEFGTFPLRALPTETKVESERLKANVESLLT